MGQGPGPCRKPVPKIGTLLDSGRHTPVFAPSFIHPPLFTPHWFIGCIKLHCTASNPPLKRVKLRFPRHKCFKPPRSKIFFAMNFKAGLCQRRIKRRAAETEEDFNGENTFPRINIAPLDKPARLTVIWIKQIERR